MNNQNTIGAIIDRTRHLIRTELSDDTSFTDELIYALLLDARNLILYRHLRRQKRYKSRLLYKTICMPLEKSSQIPCECIPGDSCMALRSKYKIPSYINLGSTDGLKVTSMDGLTRYDLTEVNLGKYTKYKRTNALKAYGTIYNDYLYLIGYPDNRLAGVLVKMIPEDPAELDNIGFCDENGEGEDTCFNPFEDTFNMEGHLIESMIRMTIEKLGGSIRLPEDISNNSNSVPIQQST